MSKKQKIWYAFFLCAGTLFTLSCTNSNLKNKELNDTTEIIQTALNDRSFLKDHIVDKSDTLFFLKSKNYNKQWPVESNYFKIRYIPDTEDAKTVLLPKGKYDHRIRIGIPKFSINKDTASIVLFNFGYNIEYHFNLKKENNTWKIVKHNILMY